MAQCKKPVGKGTVCYPCVVTAEHDGPCMSNENEPSKRARAAWLLAVEEESAPASPEAPPVPSPVVAEKRPLPHPGAEDLSAFQGPARTSATGLMEHEEEGIGGTPLSTVDTNAPGQGRTLRPNRTRTIWAGEPVEVNPAPAPFENLATVEACSVCGEPNHSKQWKHSVLEQPSSWVPPLVEEMVVSSPTKTREGDQPLPVVNDSTYIQDLVIEDIEARKQTGIERYGTPLQAHNVRNVDLDLYEELLDATTYLRQKLVERADLNDAVVAVGRLLSEAPGVPAAVWGYLDTLFAGTKSV